MFFRLLVSDTMLSTISWFTEIRYVVYSRCYVTVNHAKNDKPVDQSLEPWVMGWNLTCLDDFALYSVPVNEAQIGHELWKFRASQK